ncbi:MAG TPA: hypothetical protein VGH94_13865 [Acidimicrobiales bacterium]|jgi:hypothetical protein
MFVQVIEGKVADRDGLQRQLDRWLTDLRPTAKGFLGSTGGVAADGRGVLIARFESAEDAQANSGRPEQGAWWSETEKCFDGAVQFSDSTEVDSWMAGGSDEAGFVQIMKGRGKRAELLAMDKLFEQHAAAWRPEIIGGLRVWTGPDSYVEAAYFTSEAAAREGEKKPPPAALAENMGDYEKLMEGVEFIDLPEPRMLSA